MSARQTLVVASLAGAVAVIVGAFGAHSLPALLESQGTEVADAARRLNALETGVRYHMYHALALLGIGVWQRQHGRTAGSVAAWLMLAGIFLFSGCLYAYALTGVSALAMVVPLGGVSLIAGWIALAVSCGKT